jgi:hypothetical protein
VFVQGRLNLAELVRPPFGRWFDRAMRYLLR